MKTSIQFVGAVLVVVASGCGPVNKPLPGEEFVGVWRYSTGSMSSVCGNSTATDEIAGNEEIRFGEDSDLVLINDDGCDIRLSVSGQSAAVVPGQTCTRKGKTSEGKDITYTYSFPQYEFAISGDGRSMNAAYTVGTNLSTDGYSQICTINATGVLSKVSKN